jgi:hypothetical protein
MHQWIYMPTLTVKPESLLICKEDGCKLAAMDQRVK